MEIAEMIKAEWGGFGCMQSFGEIGGTSGVDPDDPLKKESQGG